MRNEFFKILHIVKKFNRATKSFHISISYKTASTITPRTLTVAEAFGLGVDESRRQVLYDNVELRISPTDIVYITGESGSGKSVLLKRLERLFRPNAVNMQDIKIDPSKPIIETVGKTVEEGLTLLCKVGLNDAFLFLRSYDQLSDGQKYRYRLAKLMETRKQYWVMDEFCSTLDRDTAKIVAYNIQKHARQEGKAVLAATTHTDLFEDLSPTVHVHKRFGKEITVSYYPQKPIEQCSITKHIKIEQGTLADYHKLSEFHYRESKSLPPPRKIFAMHRTDTNEIIGVIVYSYSPPTCFGRSKAPLRKRMKMKELNSRLSIISRVILHPKYRTVGLGARLVKETLPLAGAQSVEAVAVMAKYNPFFEKAGMTRLAVQTPEAPCMEASHRLRKLGFNPYLLASEKSIKEQLRKLSNRQIEECKLILEKISNPRLRRVFVNNPYGDNISFKSGLAKAKPPKLAKALRVLSILLQEKVYLFWTDSERKSF